MKEHNSVEFAGTDQFESDFPRWFGRAAGADVRDFPGTLNEAAMSLKRAEKVPLAYQDTETGEWNQTNQYVAVVDPDRLGTDEDALWQPPTDRYTVVNPMDLLGPLSAILNRRRDDVGEVYGSIREYRNGGEIHGDVLLDDVRAGAPGTPDKPFVFGFSFGTDHLGSRSTYADVIAYDTRTATAYRSLLRTVTGERRRKHTGNASQSVAGWWDELIDLVLRASDAIVDIIVEADEYEIDFSGELFDAEDYFERLGFASNHAEHAVKKLSDERRASAWELFTAITETLSEKFNGKTSGRAMRSHVKNANNILYSPPKTEDIVLEQYEEELKDQKTLTGWNPDEADAAEAVKERRESIADKVSAFKTTRERLSALVEAADEAGESLDESDGDESDENGASEDEATTTA